MKLYFNPQSRAVIAKWMLDECGANYEVVPISFEKQENRTPNFLAINPTGKLPALEDGKIRMFENAAICLYLGDKFSQARLAPAIDAPERGRYLSLMVYSTSQLEPAMGDAVLGLETHKQRGWETFERTKDVIEGELGNGPYLFGDWFTAADIMIGSMFIWKRLLTRQPERPKIDAYIERLQARPKAMKL